VVTHIAVGNKTTFIVRLFAMMQYSHQHSPTICRWVDRGKALEIHPKHKGLGNLLARFFQRECVLPRRHGQRRFETPSHPNNMIPLCVVSLRAHKTPSSCPFSVN
jgi:hypothetical protein